MVPCNNGNRLVAQVFCDDYSIVMIDTQTGQIVWAEIVSWDPGEEVALPCGHIVLSADQSIVYTIGDSGYSLKALDAAMGTEILSFNLGVQAVRLVHCQVGPTEVLGVICDGDVFYFAIPSHDLLQEVQISGHPGGPAFSTSASTLIVPIMNKNEVVAHRLDWNGGLVVTQFVAFTGSKPRNALIIQGGMFGAVVCTGDGTVVTYALPTLTPMNTFTGLRNVSDCYVHEGRIIISSYLIPGYEGWRSGIKILDPNSGMTVSSELENRYIWSLTESYFPGYTHAVDYGVDDSPGAFLTLETNTLSVQSVYPLSGAALSSCFDAATGRIYVSDEEIGKIHVFQGP